VIKCSGDQPRRMPRPLLANGNVRLATRLVDRIERILEINQITTVTNQVVEAARENLVIGVM
jgi:hypothetical protein